MFEDPHLIYTTSDTSVTLVSHYFGQPDFTALKIFV